MQTTQAGVLGEKSNLYAGLGPQACLIPDVALHDHCTSCILSKTPNEKHIYFFFFYKNVQLTKSLNASVPAQDKKIVIMRIVGHISDCVQLTVTQGVLKEKKQLY